MVEAFLDQTAAQVTKNFASDAKLKKAAVDQVRGCVCMCVGRSVGVCMYVGWV